MLPRLMGHLTNSNICRTVTDGPFMRANMSKCTLDPKKKNPCWHANTCRAFLASYKCLCNIQFYTLMFWSWFFFILNCLKIKYTKGICILDLEYFNSIASNTRETNNVFNFLFFLFKVYSNNLFLPLFFYQFYFFLFAMSVSICYKIVVKK